MPASADEFVRIVSAGGRQTGFILQVYGYWDMVAAFVRSGALDAELYTTPARRCTSNTPRSSPISQSFAKR